ncbi:redox-regulated ATPase YchF [Marinivivus vitaminiproducens]|uniref:redox-regulated ATPase YchF n=1 Tax=Marinivivus vitaminiproducens TaxID=3035935 RepID=UPI0027AAE8FB|nr:redox-regulated ATPase YchF [Geminicoccaceae bacterium SCSIO 64248]
MGFNCGIVGLPNVGKSTLFNALTSTAAAAAANYPFCTIEPNTGRVPVPDPRLDVIARLGKSARIVPTQLEVVDIAGLVRGASKGEGLGNQFLGAIRGVDAILQVLRCFEDDDVTHVEGSVDPLRDAELIETELLLADIDSLERRETGLAKRAKGGDKEAKAQLALIEAIRPAMQDGTPARRIVLDPTQQEGLGALQLLTAKPLLYVANVEEGSARGGNALSAKVEAFAETQGAAAVTVTAAIEAELAQLADEERAEYLAELGLEEPGLNRVIREGYGLLGLLTFFTVGPKEARAWTTRKGSTAPQAAGVIHTDFERGFIAAETTSYDDFVRLGGEQAAKEAGRMRLEGKQYVVQDGDIMLFRFNV